MRANDSNAKIRTISSRETSLVAGETVPRNLAVPAFYLKYLPKKQDLAGQFHVAHCYRSNVTLGRKLVKHIRMADSCYPVLNDKTACQQYLWRVASDSVFHAEEGTELMRVHVQCLGAVAKFWIKPISPGSNVGMKAPDLSKAAAKGTQSGQRESGVK